MSEIYPFSQCNCPGVLVIHYSGQIELVWWVLAIPGFYSLNELGLSLCPLQASLSSKLTASLSKYGFPVGKSFLENHMQWLHWDVHFVFKNYMLYLQTQICFLDMRI